MGQNPDGTGGTKCILYQIGDTLIISFKGTDSKKGPEKTEDWEYNLTTEVFDDRYHTGFFNRSNNFFEDVMNKIDECRPFPKQIISSGHSQGTIDLMSFKISTF